MKINKINDNQIKCILTQQDLEERHLNLREMSYNSIEIRKLFAEVISIAGKNFGFEANNVPLKIDVIPLRTSAVLFLTKVEEPEELNPSYSHFSPMVYKKMQNPTTESSDLSESFRNLLNAIFPNAEIEELPQKENPVFAESGPIIFSFDNVRDLIDACKALKPTYNHKSSLYFDDAKHVYYLKLEANEGADDNFRQNCISLLEFGSNLENDKFFDSYLAEHARVLATDNAIESIG